jgi:hypothetical protein
MKYAGTDMIKGTLFESGSGKWIELIENNARFHSNKENATVIEIDRDYLASLMDDHNIYWYYETIQFIKEEEDALLDRERKR